VDRARTTKRRAENEVEFSRIVAFSDGVFAIAITLLVLGLEIRPGLPADKVAEELFDQWDNLLAFGISFAVIGRFWLVHHRFFGEVRAFDGRLMALNLFYLAWIVLIPFSSQVLGEYGNTTAGVVTYSLNLAGVVILGWAMAGYVHRAGLTSVDEGAHREARLRAAFIAGVFLLSVPVAFLEPRVAPFLWLILFLGPIGRRITGEVR